MVSFILWLEFCNLSIVLLKRHDRAIKLNEVYTWENKSFLSLCFFLRPLIEIINVVVPSKIFRYTHRLP